MNNSKKNLMLMVPMLHQGGFERVCVTTARLMQKYYDVSILIFSDKDINYDTAEHLHKTGDRARISALHDLERIFPVVLLYGKRKIRLSG